MDQLLDFKPLSEINLADPFFDSLRNDYPGFDDWYRRKAEEKRNAFVLYGDQGLLVFVFLKSEIDVPIDDVTPPLEPCRRLKIGTLKIEAHQTKMGEHVLRLVLKEAIRLDIEEVYVTVLPKHQSLISLLETYGFKESGRKGEERVFVKGLTSVEGDIWSDYPRFDLERRTFLLAVRPEYHTKLFPDSILKNELPQSSALIQDCSYTNSIRKVYISWNEKVATLKGGDLIAIYRTTDLRAPAHYRSVVTSICTVVEVKGKWFWSSCEDFLKDVLPYSVFTKEELLSFYQEKNFYVIQMIYNYALPTKVGRGSLITEAELGRDLRWSFLPLTSKQFKYILDSGNASESLIINQA